MKKFLLFIIFSLLIFSFACNKDKNNSDEPIKDKEETIENVTNNVDIEVSLDEIELEIGKEKEILITSDKLNELSFLVNNDCATFTINDNKLIVTGNKLGNATLNIIYNNETIKNININVIEEVIYIPIPTGKLLLKGIDKEASVKVIITKDELKNEKVTWSLSSDDVVSMETQGVIARFNSLKRGSVIVTISFGEYSNSFTLYVTNIRGDID